MISRLVLTIATVCISGATTYDKDFYTAAVYAHDPGVLRPRSDNVTSRSQAVKVMMANLDILQMQVTVAKTKGADIFVFPEYGISGLLGNVLCTSYFVETIPDPSNSSPFCPCTGVYIRSGQEVLHRLSCIAKNNSMYISVNMGDKMACLNKHDVNCPAIGHYQYNTEVVFDRRGCLKAKYHKQNLFKIEMSIWNVPSSVDVSYFDTEFGRFGLMICFDAVFKSPAIDLVEKYNVTDILFSTAWMNVYPHYISTAYHSGWARTMRVNYLSSNIQFPLGRFVGSGIYGPHGVLDYTFNTSTTSGILLVTKVPINRRVDIEFPNKPLLSIVESSSSKVFFSTISGDVYKFVELTGLSGNATICNDTVCCSLEFSRSDDTESYALGVFNNLHNPVGQYHLEVCLLVRCLDGHQSCGVTLPQNSSTEFDYFTLTGAMNTRYAFPEVVTPDLNFTTDWEFVNKGYVKTIIGRNKKLASVVLMGRNFDKDPHASASKILVIKDNDVIGDGVKGHDDTSNVISNTNVNAPSFAMLLFPAVQSLSSMFFL